ncbi:MAG TPA: hypothetical protein VKZ18_06670 [Polyangia bacterium]|nr:hypothetical protein [Polyangia bacterium]
MRQDDDPSRLADHPGLDPWIGDVLRSTDPYKAPPGRKQRVLLSLGRSGPRRPSRLLRPVIVAGVLIFCGAFASAALGPWRGWLGRAYQRIAPRRAAVATAPVAPRARSRHPGASPPVALLEPAPAIPAAPPPMAAPAPPATRGASQSVHAHHAAPVAPAPQAEQDTQVVLEGMRALRVEHDPVRARALLAGYLQLHANGALAEEALALSIEAAVAHHDADAPVLAARYLRRYPSGPFRALAQQEMAGAR